MKAKLWVIISTAILIGIGITTASIIVHNNIKLMEQLSKDFDPEELIERTQIEIEPCFNTPEISEDEAIEIAIKEGGPKDRAKKIHAQYVLLTDSHHDRIPVWIVSFRGINGNKNITRHGTPVTENNFVIDSVSGRTIFCFSFR